MSTNEQYPVNDGGNSTSEQIPHSGVRGYESPVTEFDNTSLQDAHDQGLLEVPENPSSLTKEGKKGMSLKAMIGLALAGLGIAGTAGMVGKSMADGKANPTNERNPAASATPNPGETQGSGEVDSERSGFSLGSPEDYASQPSQIIVDFFEADNTWANTGYTPDAPDDPLRLELGDDVAFAATLNSESDEQYKEQMLVSDWQNNPNLVQFYETSVNTHADNTALAVKTEPVADGGFNEENVKPYERHQDPDMSTVEILSATESEIVVRVKWNSRDNRDQNIAEELISNGFDPNNESGDTTYTFREEGGSMKLADVVHNN